MKRVLYSCAVVWFTLHVTSAQQIPPFPLQAYQQFLQTHQNLTAAELKGIHPAGVFDAGIARTSTQPAYLDSIDRVYALTAHEKELLANHGFVVTSRLSKTSFMEGYGEIFHSDLPVYVSSDAILHAVHMSYDAVLMDVERSMLLPFVDSLLTALHEQVPVLAAQYSSDTSMQTMLRDADVYLTVPRILLGHVVQPYFNENRAIVDQLTTLVNGQKPVEIKLFADVARTMDFSQFTVRGHYTRSPELSHYFQAMMWLGRTELWLLAPQSAALPPSDADIQRQTINAALIVEALAGAHATALLDTIESTLRFFVGEPDNVTVAQIKSVMDETGIQRANDLLNVQRWKTFRDTLIQESFAYQRINSQILMSDPMSPEQVKPASAFLLLGQRFVIDSYVTGNVVSDKILFENMKVRRMLPSTLDVLFALGNDAAAQLLEAELARYNYASNLAAVRYLVDSYEPDFWSSSLYNGWLSMIRRLSPPADRAPLPPFMRTAAWWQKEMNTQLASWAQLRHDNLLYAKQSYTAGVICSFPESYVEPVPAFYRALSTFADMAVQRFAAMGSNAIRTYFAHMKGVADTLERIASKTLSKISLTSTERNFLKGMLILPEPVCGAPYTGWYPRLYYRGDQDLFRKDIIVADIHTAPTDESGNPVGWVLHAGTGALDMAILAAETPEGQFTAFVGPVLSYYERLTTGFKRLTDEEWVTLYSVAPSSRPNLVNLYMADKGGGSMGEAVSLITSVGNAVAPVQPSSFVLEQNYPNPFNPSTVISYSLPKTSIVSLRIFNVLGQEVALLVNERKDAGYYQATWNAAVPSGIYFYRLQSGEFVETKKMILLR
ncbi:MAG: DUF3160 domain-containing protein [Ignavibacteriales bacterium]|nr:DUF3160 domain-containing protein [Ignavibacteriales bacterium]